MVFFCTNFNQSGEVLVNVNNGPQASVSMEYTEWEPNCSMWTDGETNRRDTVNSRNFATALRNRLKMKPGSNILGRNNQIVT